MLVSMRRVGSDAALGEKFGGRARSTGSVEAEVVSSSVVMVLMGVLLRHWGTRVLL